MAPGPAAYTEDLCFIPNLDHKPFPSACIPAPLKKEGK